MHLIGIAMAQFVSASTAGVVNVMLGFVPDFVIGFFDIDGTNPNIRFWHNETEFALTGTAALSLLLTGSSGVVTRDTTGITPFAGGTQLAALETAASNPKHVSPDGVLIDDLTRFTQAGIAIPADHQTNSGKNLIIAFRRNS